MSIFDTEKVGVSKITLPGDDGRDVDDTDDAIFSIR